MAKTKILKGIASLFKSKGKDVAEGTVQPSKVFMNNLVETSLERKKFKKAFALLTTNTKTQS